MGDKSKVGYRKGEINALHDAIELFSNVVKQCVVESDPPLPMVLCLNRVDLFETKVMKGNLKAFYKDFDGGDDVKLAKKFVKDLFLKEIKSADYLASNKFQSHFIKLVDGNAAEKILTIVQKMIIAQNLSGSIES
jgi:hypothetical protein